MLKNSIKKLNIIIFLLVLPIASINCNSISSKQTDSNREKGKLNMITISLSSKQNSFSLGESVEVTLSVKNTSPTEIDIPDFVNIPNNNIYFELKTPDQKIKKLEFQGLIIRGIGVPKKETYRLAAKASYQGNYKINHLTELKQTGKHQLKATLIIDGKLYSSNAFYFELHEGINSNINIATGISINNLNIAAGKGAYVAEGKTRQSIYTFQFTETAQNIGEIELDTPTLFFEQQSPIDEVFIPQNNATVMGELISWVVWRSGNNIYAKSPILAEPIHWQAPAAVDKVLSNVHKITNGPLELAVLSKTDKQLWLLQADTDFKLLWQATLPVTPSLAIVSIPAQGIVGPHHLLLAQKNKNAYRLYHASYDTKSLGQFTTLDITNRELLSSVKPVMTIDSEQRVTLATLASTTTEQGIELILIESRHGLHKQAEIISETTIGTIDSLDEISQGVMTYSAVGNKNKRLDLVLSFTDGNIKKLHNNQLEQVSVLGKVTQPMQIMSGGTMSYILYYTAQDGYYLEPL